MGGISRSRGWDKEIPHGVLPMEQPVLSDMWARKSIHHDVLLCLLPLSIDNLRIRSTQCSNTLMSDRRSDNRMRLKKCVSLPRQSKVSGVHNFQVLIWSQI